MRYFTFFLLLVTAMYSCYRLGKSDAKLDILNSNALTDAESVKCVQSVY